MTPNRWLLLIVKALRQRTKLCESTPCVRCFFGISTCGEFLCKIRYSEAPTVSFKIAVLQNRGKPLILSSSIEFFVSVICRC